VFDITKFNKIVFFTGAGMSAESGVPTYRGKGGIWDTYDWQSVASQRAFIRDPESVLQFHNYRRSLVYDCLPNAGHGAIVNLEHEKSVHVITQNIDGLHQKAGSQNVIELHGSLWRLRCPSCGTKIDDLNKRYKKIKCRCDSWYRPDITWFEDPLDTDIFSKAERIIRNCDLFISVGTSAVVWPAAGLPSYAFGNAYCIDINLEETTVTNRYDCFICDSASSALPNLCHFA